jgi:hypothetical protein
MRNQVSCLHEATVIKDKMNSNEKYKKGMLCVAWKWLTRAVGEEHWTTVFGVVLFQETLFLNVSI